MLTKGTSRKTHGVGGLGLLGVMALLLAPAGCGGGKDSNGGTPPGTGGANGRGGANGSGGSGSGGNAGGSGGFGGLVPGNGGQGGGGAGGQGGTRDLDASVPEAGPVDAGDVDMRPTLPTAAVPAPWIGEDIGMVGMPGGSGRTRNDFQVRGSGGDIWAEADQFHFLHRPVTGDVEIVARLSAMERLSPDVKAGLMFRESNLPDARNIFMLTMPSTTAATGAVSGKGSRLQYRDKRTDNITGFVDLTMARPGSIDSPPIWLRLTRKGALFEGFISPDGVDWRKDGEISIAALPEKLSVGLAVTSHTNNNTSQSVFEGVRVSALTDPTWSHAELGTVGGFAAGAPRAFDLVSSGRGITNDEDGVTFVHRNEQHIGDVEVTARIAALSYAGKTPAKIGIMLRGMLRGDARMLSLVLELGPSGQRFRIQRRAQDLGDISSTNEMVVASADGGAPDTAVVDAGADGGADAGGEPAVALQPVWVKLVRVGQRFVGFVSESGRRGTFRPIPGLDLPSFVIASNAFVGVTLTSGTEGESAAGRIESVTITPVQTELPARPDAGSDAYPADAAADAGGDAPRG